MGANVQKLQPLGVKIDKKVPKLKKLSVKIFPLENVSFVSFWVNGNRKMAKI